MKVIKKPIFKTYANGYKWACTMLVLGHRTTKVNADCKISEIGYSSSFDAGIYDAIDDFTQRLLE